jgi:DNA polymerase-3 subunit delta
MAAIKAGEVERTLRRLDPRTAVLLFYGPDAGLVAERARAAAEHFVSDPADPFQLVRLDGDVVASDPARLADEAGTIGLFGGRRSLWVRPTGRNIASAIEPVLSNPAPDTLIVVEAGDLGRSSPLRTLCERHPLAWALPCYADEGASLSEVVDQTLREAALAISPDVKRLLIANLGGDRLASRSELGKLALYTHGRGEITAEDVEAVISDVSSVAQDAGIDAAFGGQRPELDASLRRLRAEGATPSAVLGAALRHALLLLAARADVEAGRNASAVVEAWRGLHFRRKTAVQKQLAGWRTTALVAAVGRLQAAVLESRRSPDLGGSLTAQVLSDLAGEASRAGRG